jgi:predicted N-acetyltransferase YhbS
MFGGDQHHAGSETMLNPEVEPARVRAFFVHPSWARRGIGRAMLARCETEILAAGFQTAELVATLAGEPLYASFNYQVIERYNVPMSGGLALPAVRMAKRLRP